MSTEQLNQVLTIKDEDNVPLPNTMEKKQITREMPVKKKRELESEPEDRPQPIGEYVKYFCPSSWFTSHRYYEKFQFHGTTYGLNDTVVLIPEEANHKPCVAIIKDIYVRDNGGSVQLIVQWFYRPEDVDKKYVRHWKSKDARELLYSLHHDEVTAESVMNSCSVYFVPENEQIPKPGEYPDFIVRKFYDCVKKKLWKLSDAVFHEYDQKELDIFVAKTISLAGDLLDTEKKKKSRRKQAFPRRIIKDAEGNIVYKKSHELVNQIKDGPSVDEGTADNEEPGIDEGTADNEEPWIDEGTADNEEPGIDDASSSTSVQR